MKQSSPASHETREEKRLLTPVLSPDPSPIRWARGTGAEEEREKEGRAGTAELNPFRPQFNRPSGTWASSDTQPNAKALGYSHDVPPGQGPLNVRKAVGPGARRLRRFTV